MKEEQLIFIISQPRAGSTLLQKILSNNNQVGTTNESWSLFPFISIIKPELIKSIYNQKYVNWAYMEYFKNNTKDLSKWVLSCLDSFYAHKEINTYDYILDKTPRYYELLFEIKQLYPSCKIILLLRNHLNVLYSIKNTWIDQKGIGFLVNYYRDLLYAPFLINDFIDKYKHDSNVITVQYELLVSDPLNTVKDVYNKLGLDFNGNVLNYENNQKTDGLLGDPTGIAKHRRPVEENQDKWKELLRIPYWKKFVPGYINYLSPLLDDHTSHLGCKTRVFNRYKKFSNNYYF